MLLKFQCTKDSFKGASAGCVSAFDALESFDRLMDFYRSFDPKLAYTKEEYFRNAPPADVWEDYVIWDAGRIASRAAIWKYSPTAWEVAAVATLPELRGKGYSKLLVSHCTAIILSRGLVATCTTEDTNTAMRRVLEKVGFTETK